MNLQGKTILITGATGALGSEVARQCAATGANLVLTARSTAKLEELKQALALPAEQALTCPADLASPAGVAELINNLAARYGGADILLHTAGGWEGGTALADLTDDAWQAVLTLNLQTAFYVNRAVLPWMLQHSWGRVVNIAARAAVLPGIRSAAYNVAKAGVVALTASIAQDYRRAGITANCILPGTIDTPGNRRDRPDANFTRWVKPADIAAAMLCLAGDSDAINGAVIPIYGQS